MLGQDRNPHAGVPFTDDDATIAAALEDVSVPALLCSLVHMTGDPSWIRGELRPQVAVLNDYQGGMSEEMQAEVRRRALPAIAAYRDGGCVPQPPSPGARRRDDGVPRLRTGRPRCRADVPRGPAPRRERRQRRSRGATRSPPRSRPTRRVIVIGCGESGSSPASASPRPACRSRSSRRTTAPAAPGGRTATPALGSTSAATSTATRSSRPTTGASTSASSPSCATTSPGCSTSTTSARTAGSAPRSSPRPTTRPTAGGRSRCAGRRRHRPRCSTPGS